MLDHIGVRGRSLTPTMVYISYLPSRSTQHIEVSTPHHSAGIYWVNKSDRYQKPSLYRKAVPLAVLSTEGRSLVQGDQNE